MPIQQPGRGGGIHGRGVAPMCGQGGRRAELTPGIRRPFPYFRTALFQGSYILTGVTKDSTGAALAGVTVKVFDVSNNLIAMTVSDGAGNYSIPLGNNGPVYMVAYLAGAPDVAGTTINGVVPIPV